MTVPSSDSREPLLLCVATLLSCSPLQETSLKAKPGEKALGGEGKVFHFSCSLDQGSCFNYSSSFSPEEYLILGQHQKLIPAANNFYFGKLVVFCYC